MRDEQLRIDVTDEIRWDPKIDGQAIAVSVGDGIVTLRGTVGSYVEKREAKKAAERIWGVKWVDADQLDVRFLDNFVHDDADLRGSVLQALMLDSLVPSTIDVKVDNGVVTLTGTAEWQFQREEAETTAGRVIGVTEVDDHVDLLNPEPKAADVAHSIEKAFKRSAKVDAKGISVTTDNGTVRLAGTVTSWAEHDDALAAAWAAPGVTKVEDLLEVDY
jgi:osmotically-inducible protein OsmY